MSINGIGELRIIDNVKGKPCLDLTVADAEKVRQIISHLPTRTETEAHGQLEGLR